MRDFSQDHHWLSLNTATVRVQWKLDRIIAECARRGIRAISPWRDQVAAVGLDTVARLVRDTGLELSGYCRGGMFPASTVLGRQRALDDNRQAVDEAKALNASCLVLVVGGLPGALEGNAEHKDLAAARDDVRDGIAVTLEYARSVGMPLAIEPLHPMYAAERACINTMEQALDLCDALDPQRTGALGVAVDVYHVWWDPKLEAQIAARGQGAAPRLPRMRLARAHARPLERPRHDGRWRHRNPAHPRLDGSAGLRRLQRSGDLFRRELVEARRRRGGRHMHRAAQNRGVSDFR